jgi:hypothetical protein
MRTILETEYFLNMFVEVWKKCQLIQIIRI